MIALLANPPAPLALRVDLLEFRKPRPPPPFPELILKLHKIIANPASHAEEVKIAKRALLDAIGESKQSPLAGAARRPSPRQRVDAKHPAAAWSRQQHRDRRTHQTTGGTMKEIKIDLLKPFGKVLRAVLSAPEDDKGIGEGAAQNSTGSVFAKPVNQGAVSKPELKRVLRCLYEAAHGRQVETQIGLVTIAPPVAASLKENPFYIKTQVDFLLEALTRIIGGASHANSGIPPPKTFCKKGLLESPARNNSSKVERKNADTKIDLQSNRFLRPKRPAFLE
jgi:hypothetical protein